MLFGTLSAHFRSKLKIDIFHLNNIKLFFLKKRFFDFAYNFSDASHIRKFPNFLKCKHHDHKLASLLNTLSANARGREPSLFFFKCVDRREGRLTDCTADLKRGPTRDFYCLSNRQTFLLSFVGGYRNIRYMSGIFQKVTF